MKRRSGILRSTPTKRRHGVRQRPAIVSGFLGLVLVAALAVAPTAASAGTSPTSQSKAPATSAAGDGVVSGTVTITGVPKKNPPTLIGVGACQGSPVAPCVNPRFTLAATTNGGYSLPLPVGSWHIQAFYEIDPFGGAFLGSTGVVTIVAGHVSHADVTVKYRAPGAISGSVTINDVPPGMKISAAYVEACPAYAPYKGGAQPPLECVNSEDELEEGSSPGGVFSLASLPPGTWIVYPTYDSIYGTTVTSPGTRVLVTSGATAHLDTEGTYRSPVEGLVTGTTTITGIPKSSPAEQFIVACPGRTVSLSCRHQVEVLPNQSTVSSSGSSTAGYSTLLSPGTWSIAPSYSSILYGGSKLGPAARVTVIAGDTVSVPLTMAYDDPGTATGTITISDLPIKTAVDEYTVLACPVGFPATSIGAELNCGSESSGVATGTGSYPYDLPYYSPSTSNEASAHGGLQLHIPATTNPGYASYSMDLPSGTWLLYPGYETIYGQTTATVGTPITVTAQSPTTKDLTLAFKAPTDGAVAGIATTLDVPTSIFSGYPDVSGVEACLLKPTSRATECDSEDFSSVVSSESGSASLIFGNYFTSQIGPDGSYQLALPPGTWWIAGTYLYWNPDGDGGLSSQEYAGASTEVTVTAGATTTQNVVATYGPG